MKQNENRLLVSSEEEVALCGAASSSASVSGVVRSERTRSTRKSSRKGVAIVVTGWGKQIPS